METDTGTHTGTHTGTDTETDTETAPDQLTPVIWHTLEERAFVPQRPLPPISRAALAAYERLRQRRHGTRVEHDDQLARRLPPAATPPGLSMAAAAAAVAAAAEVEPPYWPEHADSLLLPTDTTPTVDEAQDRFIWRLEAAAEELRAAAPASTPTGELFTVTDRLRTAIRQSPRRLWDPSSRTRPEPRSEIEYLLRRAELHRGGRARPRSRPRSRPGSRRRGGNQRKSRRRKSRKHKSSNKKGRKSRRRKNKC